MPHLQQPQGATLSHASSANDHRFFLHSSTDTHEVQTESAFYGNNVTELRRQFSNTAVRQFDELKKLRDAIKGSMTEVALSIYDINAYKDVVLVMQHQLPDMPVTDLLLSSSKLFRRGSELARLLGCFFNICFAEDFVDEHFHFTEIRLAKKEIQQLRQDLERAKKEKELIQSQYDKLSANSVHHAHAIQVLESRNDILELRSSALEDQMAVLFQQIAEDFRNSSAAFIQQSVEDLDVQEELSATRAAFINSVESVQQRMMTFQNVIVDIQEDPVLSGQDQGFRNRVKSLDVHVQYIIQRFGSVKDGLSQVAQELIASIMEKRKVLNFAMQHLKLYDCQSGKVRQAKASLHDVRQKGADIEKFVQHTFAAGCNVRIERSGDIVVEEPPASAAAGSPRGGSSTGGTAQPSTTPGGPNASRYVLTNIRTLQETIQRLMEAAVQVSTALDSEDEQRTLLKTISMTVPSQGRTDTKVQDAAFGPGGSAGTLRIKQGMNPGGPEVRPGSFEITDSYSRSGSAATARPSVAGSFSRQSVSASISGGTVGSRGAIDEETMAQALYDLQKQRDELSGKLGFLKQVYEERIADLEQKLERTQRRAFNLNVELNKRKNEESIKREAQEKEMLLRAKEVWGEARDDLQEQSRATRLDAFQTLSDLGTHVSGGLGAPSAGDGDTQALLSNLASSGRRTSAFPSGEALFDDDAMGDESPRTRASINVPMPHQFPTLRTPQKQQRDKQAEILRLMRQLNQQAVATASPTDSRKKQATSIR